MMLLDSKIISLLKVVETGNYTLAGKALSLTQPAVSQHIRAIENEFGIRIFERVDKKLLLTREGEIVVRYCRRMQSLYNNLSRDIQNGTDRVLSLNIGITHTIESNRISEALAKYASTHKGTTITLITDAVSGLRERLKNYELDFAIIDGKINDHCLINTLLDVDKLMLIVSPDHPYADKEFVTVDELRREDLILRLPNSGTRDLFRASMESRGINVDEMNVLLEVDNIATIKDLIRHGYGASVLARSACMDELRKRKLVALPIEDLNMVREINFVYSRDFGSPQILEEITEIYGAM
ncbi:MAG: LysR family transcriptional regulator [Lachnospiraceae bacterium]|nr:LysR family transcriptional regulator [Sarcina sp.]MBQ6590983.1 LysR family transcriptional regulator [Lachnospiraceae bacterium]